MNWWAKSTGRSMVCNCALDSLSAMISEKVLASTIMLMMNSRTSVGNSSLSGALSCAFSQACCVVTESSGLCRVLQTVDELPWLAVFRGAKVYGEVVLRAVGD